MLHLDTRQLNIQTMHVLSPGYQHKQLPTANQSTASTAPTHPLLHEVLCEQRLAGRHDAALPAHARSSSHIRNASLGSLVLLSALAFPVCGQKSMYLHYEPHTAMKTPNLDVVHYHAYC